MMAARGVDGIVEVFKCVICMEKIRDARLCPKCSKLCCYACIRRWLTEQSTACPHCRASLQLADLIKCRFADDVMLQLESLAVTSGGDAAAASGASAGSAVSHAQEDKCLFHDEKCTVYCCYCHTCLCYQCALWGGTHSGHTLKPLDEVYDQRATQIKEEAKKLRRRLIKLAGVSQECDNTMDALRSSKEVCGRETRCVAELMVARLEPQLRSKLAPFIAQKTACGEEMDLLESLLREVDKQLSAGSKSDLLTKSGDLLQVFGQILAKPVPGLRDSAPGQLEFASEIVPPYHGQVFAIQNFSQYRAKADPIYSPSLFVNGLCWRLKVYPDGNGMVRGNYLSVFLELFSGRAETVKYEYRVEMCHVTNEQPRSIMREFASDFEVGECWGYNRFFKLEHLYDEGFLGDGDTLTLRFQVRAPTYYQQCKDMSWYLGQLEGAQAETMAYVAFLKQQLRSTAARNGENGPFAIEASLSRVSEASAISSNDFIFPPEARDEPQLQHAAEASETRSRDETSSTAEPFSDEDLNRRIESANYHYTPLGYVDFNKSQNRGLSQSYRAAAAPNHAGEQLLRQPNAEGASANDENDIDDQTMSTDNDVEQIQHLVSDLVVECNFSQDEEEQGSHLHSPQTLTATIASSPAMIVELRNTADTQPLLDFTQRFNASLVGRSKRHSVPANSAASVARQPVSRGRFESANQTASRYGFCSPPARLRASNAGEATQFSFEPPPMVVDESRSALLVAGCSQPIGFAAVMRSPRDSFTAMPKDEPK